MGGKVLLKNETKVLLYLILDWCTMVLISGINPLDLVRVISAGYDGRKRKAQDRLLSGAG